MHVYGKKKKKKNLFHRGEMGDQFSRMTLLFLLHDPIFSMKIPDIFTVKPILKQRQIRNLTSHHQLLEMIYTITFFFAPKLVQKCGAKVLHHPFALSL